jgi:hypothetical protein
MVYHYINVAYIAVSLRTIQNLTLPPTEKLNSIKFLNNCGCLLSFTESALFYNALFRMQEKCALGMEFRASPTGFPSVVAQYPWLQGNSTLVAFRCTGSATAYAAILNTVRVAVYIRLVK